MHFLSLLEAKRDGKALSASEAESIIREYTCGAIPDYQMAAFLMAVYFRGLSAIETSALTQAMRRSGDVLTWPAGAPLVDKHSTGGVGDKVSLPLAPLLAALGFRVPMISGRGLGITGGTLDKLESIPGFSTALSIRDIQQIVGDCGCVICGQTDQMVPADKRLYALRDVTGTVASIPLIVASIMSKKLAEGLDALILDVKFGAAAFMRTATDARNLAEAMIAIGRDSGMKTRAVLTRMDAPLGTAAGNWLEVKEAVECLNNAGPADLRELVITFAAHLMAATNMERNLHTAREKAVQCLASGKASEAWERMLKAQGATLDEFHALLQEDHAAPFVAEAKSQRAGFVTSCDARIIGELVRDLGGGRVNKDSLLDHSVGVDQLLKPGEMVRAGAVLGRIHASTEEMADRGCQRLVSAYTIAESPTEIPKLILNVMGA